MTETIVFKNLMTGEVKIEKKVKGFRVTDKKLERFVIYFKNLKFEIWNQSEVDIVNQSNMFDQTFKLFDVWSNFSLNIESLTIMFDKFSIVWQIF